MVALFAGKLLGSTTGTIIQNQWNSIVVRTKGPGQGIDVFVNGMSITGVPTGNTNDGFDANQADAVTVGPLTGTDIDDLRFYNVAFTYAEVCARATRGWLDPNLTCHVGAPMQELSLENSYLDTGTSHMSVNSQPRTATFETGTLGEGLRLSAAAETLSETGLLSGLVGSQPHTITLSYQTDAGQYLFDTRRACGGILLFPTYCGVLVFATNTMLEIGVYNHTRDIVTPNYSTTVAADSSTHTVVIAEHNNGTVSTGMSIYVDGTLGNTLTFPTSGTTSFQAFDLRHTNDLLVFSRLANGFVDEIQFWQTDLTATTDTLCENGFDGQWDPVALSCTLTAN